MEITVKDFIDSYNSAPNAAAKTKCCKEIITTEYVPVLDKYSALVASFHKSLNRLEDGRVFLNSFTRYINETMVILKLYTNLMVTGEGIFTDEVYDELKKSGALTEIYSLIGKAELDEVGFISAQIEEDFRDNELSTAAFLNKQINAILDVMDTLTPDN